MPYVITTRYSDCDFPDSCGECDITRTAVATADDARRAIIAIGEQHDTWIGGDALHGPIDRNGGTIGPLPDGTVIEVRPVEWADLPPITEARKRYPHGPAHEAVLRDFNAGAR